MIRILGSTASTRYTLVRRARIAVLNFMLQGKGRKVTADMSRRKNSGPNGIHKTDLDSTLPGSEAQLEADQLKSGSGDCSGAFPRCP